MIELWQARKRSYHNYLLKYLKYVLNDHLMIAFLFLIGGCGLEYANFIKIISSRVNTIKIIILSVFSIVPLIIGPILLFKKADELFLLPMEKKIKSYLIKSFKYSLIYKISIILMVELICFPMLIILFNKMFYLLLFYIIVVTIGISDLIVKYDGLYFQNIKSNYFIIKFLVTVIVLFISIYISIYLGLILAIVILIASYSMFLRNSKISYFDWERGINDSLKFISYLNRFFSLFTNVSILNIKSKRRKYLDFLNNILEGKSDNNPIMIIYSRITTRNGDLSGLLFRLIGIGVLLELFVDNTILKCVLGMLVTYLVVIHVRNINYLADNQELIKIYPIYDNQIYQGIKTITFKISIIVSLMMIISSNLLNFSSLSLVSSIFTQLLVLIYVYLNFNNYLKTNRI